MLTATALLLAATWSAPAWAQSEDLYVKTGAGTQMITGFMGGQLIDLGDQFEFEGAHFPTQIDFGARYQYNLTDRWGVEGSFLFSPGEPQLAFTVFPQVEVDAYQFHVNGVYNILNHSRVVPYATAGLGAVRLSISGRGPGVGQNGSETFLAGNFGGGVLYQVAERVAVRVDMRDLIYHADHFDGDSLQVLRLPVDFTKTIHNLALNVGLSFVF